MVDQHLPTTLDKYRSSRELRAALQMIPFGIGAAIDSYFGSKADEDAERRIFRLITDVQDDMLRLSKSVDIEYAKTADYAQLFKGAVEVAHRDLKNEKIDVLKNALISFAMKRGRNSDFFHSVLEMLDHLSHSEIQMLAELYSLPGHQKSETSFEAVDDGISRFFVDRLIGLRLITEDSGRVALTLPAIRLAEVISDHDSD